MVFNWQAPALSAAGVRAAVGLASANLDTKLDALPLLTQIVAAISVIPRTGTLPNFMFRMTNSSGQGLAGLTVTARRRIDGGAFGAFANSVVELSGGDYKIDWAASDKNGKVIMYEFAASGAVTICRTLLTQG